MGLNCLLGFIGHFLYKGSVAVLDQSLHLANNGYQSFGNMYTRQRVIPGFLPFPAMTRRIICEIPYHIQLGDYTTW